MNLLELIKQTCEELSLDVPTLVVGNSDQQTSQMLALLNRHGHDLVRNYAWQELNKQFILRTVAFPLTGTTTAGSTIITGINDTYGHGISVNFGVTGTGILPFSKIVQIDSMTQVTLDQPATQTATSSLQFSQLAYPLPEDWSRQVEQTEWDRTNRWPLMGPKSPQEWQSYQSGVVYAGPRQRFRIQGNAVQISPPPPDGLIFAYEYISNYWVTSSDGVGQAYFLADTDTTMFDDSLMISGLKMRWKQEKGLDYSFHAIEFKALLEACTSQNKSAPKLSLAPAYGDVLISGANIPDGSWGGPNGF